MYGYDDAIYNDDDIEMMLLNSGFYDDEPGCSHCGASDSMVSIFRDTHQQANMVSVAEANGLGIHQVCGCVECGSIVNNAGKGRESGKILYTPSHSANVEEL